MRVHRMTKLEAQVEPGVGFSTLKSNETPDSPNAHWLFFQDAHMQMAKHVNQPI